MRLWQERTKEDVIQCNNEKLVAGSTRSYVHDAEEAISTHFFPEGGPWPDMIVGPTQLTASDEYPSYDTEVRGRGETIESRTPLLNVCRF